MTADNQEQPEPAQPACSSCFYFRGSLCKRYPAPQRVPADHWCGEYDASPQSDAQCPDLPGAGLSI